MPVNINFQRNEPIMIFTVGKNATTKELIEAYWCSVRLVEHRVYCIIDLSDSMNANELVNAFIAKVIEALDTPISAQRICFVCHSNNGFMKILGVSCFDNINLAQSYARQFSGMVASV